MRSWVNKERSRSGFVLSIDQKYFFNKKETMKESYSIKEFDISGS